MFQFFSRQYAAATSPEAIEGFTTSWLLPSPVLFFWRALISLYAFVVLFTTIGYQTGNGNSDAAGRSFSYFTVLGYWGLAFYYAFAAVHTASHWIRGKSYLQSWPSGLQWAHSCLYSTITTFPIIVTIVFWTVLARGAFRSQFSTWSNISQHGLNTVFALAEVLIPRTRPSPWINLIVVIVLLALYLALAAVTYAVQGWYVYLFLDPSWHGNGFVGGACVIILIGTTLVFVIARYLILLRQRVTEGGNKGLDARNASDEYGSVEPVPMQRMTEGGTSPEKRMEGLV